MNKVYTYQYEVNYDPAMPVVKIHNGRRWRVRTDKKTYHVLMPPLVLVGQGHAYSFYAVKQKPALNTSAGSTQALSKGPLTLHTPLYHVPAPTCLPLAAFVRELPPSLPVRPKA